MNIYVGNLSFNATNDMVSDLFAEYGTVNSARIIVDRETNRSKGFGFVEMEDDTEAQNAIDALNSHELDGRAITVNMARERKPRSNGNFGGSFNGGYSN